MALPNISKLLKSLVLIILLANFKVVPPSSLELMSSLYRLYDAPFITLFELIPAMAHSPISTYLPHRSLSKTSRTNYIPSPASLPKTRRQTLQDNHTYPSQLARRNRLLLAHVKFVPPPPPFCDNRFNNIF